MRQHFVFIVTVAMLAARCAAQKPCPIEEIARIGGEFATVSSSEQLAMVSAANRLLIMDVSVLSEPVLVGQLDGLDGLGMHRLTGSIGVVLVSDEVRFVDLKDPALPTVVGSVTPLAGRVSYDRPGVDGTVAYIAYPGSTTTIVSIDFSDPVNPVVLDTLELPESSMAYISAGGGVVGCTIRGFGTANQIFFIDAADPAKLEVASRLNPAQYSEDIACNGTIACVLVPFGIAIYDTSDPYRPTLIGGATTFSWFNVEVELSSDTLFACVGYDFGGGAMFAFDMTDPSRPLALGNSIRTIDYAPRSVAPSGHGALLLADSSLKSIQLRPSLGVIGEYASDGADCDVALENGRLIFSSTSGLHVYDVSDPQSPVKTGAMLQYSRRGPRLAVDGDLAYFVRNGNLSIFDVSPPTGPLLLHSQYVQCLWHVAVDGDVGVGAITSSCADGVVVFDLSDVTNPKISSVLPVARIPRGLAIEGDIAVVAAGSLYVIDVSDPMSPQVVAQLPSQAEHVVMNDGFAYVSMQGGTGAVFDLTNPSWPKQVGTFTTGQGGARDLAYGGNRIHVSVHAAAQSLRMIDVTNRSAPELIGWFDAPYQAEFLAADNRGYIALARGDAGISFLEACPPCYADCSRVTGNGVLDIFDFLCFQSSFMRSGAYACDCDTTTGNGVCDIFDFLCFQNAFVGGCP